MATVGLLVCQTVYAPTQPPEMYCSEGGHEICGERLGEMQCNKSPMLDSETTLHVNYVKETKRITFATRNHVV